MSYSCGYMWNLCGGHVKFVWWREIYVITCEICVMMCEMYMMTWNLCDDVRNLCEDMWNWCDQVWFWIMSCGSLESVLHAVPDLMKEELCSVLLCSSVLPSASFTSGTRSCTSSSWTRHLINGISRRFTSSWWTTGVLLMILQKISHFYFL